jgi:protein-disulfide isomerase-like protein with CxxC motif
MPRIAQTNPDAPLEIARRGADAVAGMAEDAARATQEVARAAAQAAPAAHEVMDAADAARALLELAAEQTRHNLEAAAAFQLAVDWSALVTLQRDFLSATAARMGAASDRWRSLLQIAASGARR